MDIGNIKALTFDTGGTILDWHTGFRDSLAALGAKYGVEQNWVLALPALLASLALPSPGLPLGPAAGCAPRLWVIPWVRLGGGTNGPKTVSAGFDATA